MGVTADYLTIVATNHCNLSSESPQCCWKMLYVRSWSFFSRGLPDFHKISPQLWFQRRRNSMNYRSWLARCLLPPLILLSAVYETEGTLWRSWTTRNELLSLGVSHTIHLDGISPLSETLLLCGEVNSVSRVVSRVFVVMVRGCLAEDLLSRLEFTEWLCGLLLLHSSWLFLRLRLLYAWYPRLLCHAVFYSSRSVFKLSESVISTERCVTYATLFNRNVPAAR